MDIPPEILQQTFFSTKTNQTKNLKTQEKS